VSSRANTIVTAIVKLPSPNLRGTISLEESIHKRRSVRKFKSEPLALMQISQLLWAAQGSTSKDRERAVPSAGATYPLEIYVTTGNETIEMLKAGIYHYDTGNHALILHLEGDVRAKLAKAALDQDFMASCPANIILCAVFSRTTGTYGKRGERYVYMEAGHAGQNISLAAISLGLATVMIGAFHDDHISKLLHLYEYIEPLYIIPIGKPA
jgi:SagB-type dehydrogenase family enzyme